MLRASQRIGFGLKPRRRDRSGSSPARACIESFPASQVSTHDHHVCSFAQSGELIHGYDSGGRENWRREYVAIRRAYKHVVTDRSADANDSRSLQPRQNDGHYVIDSNTNHNHDLKDIFKGAAMGASTAAGPLRDFYEALLAKGRKPTMARLTLARKIAAITLIVWKKEVRFDANYLKQQAA